MDGKKRIARLRNAEKWKKKFGMSRPGKKQDRIKKIIAKHAPMAKPQAVGLSGPFIEAKHAGADKIWDDLNCCYIEKPKGIFKSAYGFMDALTKRGYKVLGSGAYSTVYAKGDSDRVIKVQRGNDNWIDYCKWAAEKGFSGGFAPKVYSFKRFNGFAVAVMERMDRNTNNEKDELCLVERLLGPARRGNIMAKLFLEELAPQSSVFFDKLFATFDGHLDLYGKNIMIRKDGTLCVTDPVCGKSKLTSVKRLRTGDFSPAPIDYETNRSYSLWNISIDVCSYA